LDARKQTVVVAARKGVDDDYSSSDEVAQYDTCSAMSQSVKFPAQAGSHI
jgi:hypothetical protein